MYKSKSAILQCVQFTTFVIIDTTTDRSVDTKQKFILFPFKKIKLFKIHRFK